jgi:hypothetical protein
MGNAFSSEQKSPASGPPAVPKELSFYLVISGKQAGPFNLAKIEEMAKNKEIDKNTLAWKEGMSDWLPSCEIDELKKAFTSVPPPIPGK